MTVSLDLAPEQMVSLCRVVAASGCTPDEVLEALASYPGSFGADEYLSPAAPVRLQITGCADSIAKERAYLAPSFVLRLVVLGWTREAMQNGIVEHVPSLLQPPRSLDRPIAVVAAALQALVDQLPPVPNQTNLGNAAIYHTVCTLRDEVANAASAVRRFGMLKDVHDALHLLQVLGTTWLDPIPPPTTAVAAPLPRLLESVRLATQDAPADLPPDLAACCARCLDTVLDASRRIGTGDEDERDYAYAALRTMLMQELPRIDAAMFAVSRAFPLRRFRLLFPDPADQEAAVDLVDTIRRRLMEHGLWQITDQRLYVIEQTLVNPTPLLIIQLSRGPWPAALYSLRLLIGRETTLRVQAPLQDALLRYMLSTDPNQARDSPIAGSEAELRTSFAALRDAARSAFLATDQALKRDFEALQRLLAPLQALLDRVPAWCGLLANQP